jgi:hypothetical protein
MICTSDVIGRLHGRLVMISSWISRASVFPLMHDTIKQEAMDALSSSATQLSSWDHYMVHVSQNLFGNIVRVMAACPHDDAPATLGNAMASTNDNLFLLTNSNDHSMDSQAQALPG